MFGEMTEIVVMQRMKQLQEEAARAQLIRIARAGKQSPSPRQMMRGMIRRMTTLPGLALHWWKAPARHRPVPARTSSTGK